MVNTRNMIALKQYLINVFMIKIISGKDEIHIIGFSLYII